MAGTFEMGGAMDLYQYLSTNVSQPSARSINIIIIVLHSSHCVNKQQCSVCPRGLMYSIRVVDKGLIHLNAYCVVKSGEVNWDLIDFESEEK